LGKELDSSGSNQPGVKACDSNLKISQSLRGLFIISVPKLQVSLELPEISFSEEHITSTVPIASKLKGVTAAVLSVIQGELVNRLPAPPSSHACQCLC